MIDGGYCSLYTQIIYYVLTSRKRISEGRIFLTDISDEVQYMMEQWNRTHPGREKEPNALFGKHMRVVADMALIQMDSEEVKAAVF